MAEYSALQKKVEAVVRKIPRGQVLSYGQVAGLCGIPGGARAVVRALGTLTDLPWWRVIRSDQTIAEQMMPEQAVHLRREGVSVEGRRVRVQTRKKRLKKTRR